MDHGRILVDNTPAELKKMIPGGNALEIHVQFDESAPDQDVRRARLLERLGTLPAVTKAEEIREAPKAAAAAAPRGGGFGGPGPGQYGGWQAAAPEPEHGVATFRIYAHESGTLIGAAAQAVLDAGGRVRDISVKQATLEEVFIYLTGRHLR
jgi:ABC-2 type transport system ATP-binding protein